MARRARKEEPAPERKKRAWEGDIVQPDDFMKDWRDEIETSTQMFGSYVGDLAERMVVGIPLMSLSQRLIFQCTHAPLGRTIHVFGLTESMKSALCFEFMRWIARMVGGRCTYCLTETGRDQGSLRNSTVGYQFRQRIETAQCDSMEAWQDRNTSVVKTLMARSPYIGGYAWPIGIFVDSLLGSASQITIDNVMRDGHASLSYATEANLLNIFTKVIPQKISQWPILWVGTNHMKVAKDAKTQQLLKRTGGGASVGFYTTFGIELSKVRDYRYSDGTRGREIQIVTQKNSLGDGRVKLKIDVLWWHDGGLQTTVWDWHGATINYLDQLYDIEADAGYKKKIAAIVDLDIDKKNARVTSKTLKLKRATFGEAGQAIEDNVGVREALDALFGIHKGRPFIPGVPFRDQLVMAMENQPIDDLLAEYPIWEPDNPEAEAAARLEVAAEMAAEAAANGFAGDGAQEETADVQPDA